MQREQSDPTDHVYSRDSAPNTTRLETILTSLIGGRCLAYSSGLSALYAALVALNPRRISIGDGYHGSHGVISTISRLSGLQKLDLDCPAQSLEQGDVVVLETPVNPHGTSFNIQTYADKAHSRGAHLIVDSTFGPPGLQDPFAHGADIVLHSGTKYIGGHSDMLCGVLATKRPEWVAKLRDDRMFLGNVMGSMESWLGVRSVRTLELRVQRQSQNATRLVEWLDGALKVASPAPDSPEAVVQAGLQEITHSSLQTADMGWLKKQMPGGFGPVFSITMKEERLARELPEKLSFFHHATSLGGVESLIEWRAMSDPVVDRRLVRVSVGVENWEDLRGDIVAGLRRVFRKA